MNFNPRTPCGVRPCWLSREYSQKNFNPRTPCGVRRKTRRRLGRSSIFQSTHPLRGATTDMRLPQQHLLDFNPRTPCGVRLCQWCKNSDADKFQSTHPLRGATIALAQRKQAEAISIHAPLAGCDLRKPQPRKPQPNFNPRTPCGVRRVRCSATRRRTIFQSTHPLRGATPSEELQTLPTAFQSTHPLRGATKSEPNTFTWGVISIHAPLAGCDQEICCKALGKDGISIHAPLAGCDDHRVLFRHAVPISIHAPLAGCDLAVSRSSRRAANFNPRTPCGVRPESGNRRRQWEEFQSTHPLRGATRKRHDLHRKSEISIHAPLAGCDRCWRRSRRRSSHFNPRTPCGVRRNRHTGGLTWTRFQSTHPLRGATDHRVLFRHAVPISIHAPLAGCDKLEISVPVALC